MAQNSFGDSLVAYRPVSGGHTTVGVTAYVGFDATQSGDWGKVIVNAGNWLANCQGVSPTPTATATATPTATANSYVYANGNSYCNGNGDSTALHCDCGAEVYADAQAASHASSTPISSSV